MDPKRQSGFTALEAVIVIVMVVLIALAGWWVFAQTQDDVETTEETTQTQTEDNTPAAEQAEDLENAEQYLEDLDIEGDLDTTELDSSLTY